MEAKSYKYTINGKDYQVSIQSVENGLAEVDVNGQKYSVQMEQPKEEEKAIVRPQATVASAPVSATPAANTAGAEAVVAPLPGVVVEICCKVGEAVKAGQKVAVLEAMKMENVLNAPKDGVVSAIKVNSGDSVMEGTALVLIS